MRWVTWRAVCGRPLKQVDGDFQYDNRRNVLMWQIQLIDKSNRNGSMEFVVPAGDSDGFFPIEAGAHTRPLLSST